MGLPKKIKKDIQLVPDKTLLSRREELLSFINKDGTYLPKSVLHEDLDNGMLEFVKENFTFSVDGKEIPFVDIILSTQNWSQYTETWKFNDTDYNVIPPFICLIKQPEMKYGSNPSTLYTIPNRKPFYYVTVPTWDGQRKGADVYQIPQPVPVDISFSLKIVSNRQRELNKLNKLVLQKFSSRQAYQLIKGQYVPIIMNSFSDESQLSIDNRKYYSQNYDFIMLGYLIDEEEFKVKPAISRVVQMYEVDTNTYKRQKEVKTIETPFYTIKTENNTYEETIRYTADLIYVSSDNVSSFDVYINNDYYGSDIRGIKISTNDVLKFEITKTSLGLSTINFKVILDGIGGFQNTPKPSVTPTSTPTPTNTVTPSNTPTQTQTPTNTQTPSQTPTQTITPTNTVTPSNTPTQTQTPTNTVTPSQTPTQTQTPTRTVTPTNSITPSITPTNTQTPSQTITNTVTLTPTQTSSQTPTNTVTPTKTQTPTVTSSVTPTMTNTPTPTSNSGGLVTTNLVMELDATNYTSGSWIDDSGNGNNATINGATWVSTDGGIFDLDGINDNISIADNSDLRLSTTTQKTIQVWVKFDALPGTGQQIAVVGKLSSNFVFDGYWAGLYSDGGIVRCTTNGTGSQKVSDSTLTININTWYLFTFISQITSTANTTKVYINTTEYITSSHGSDTYSEANPLYLGYIGSGVGSLYLNGKIGACYFYTKGLSVSEITQNFNATKTKYGL